jgi:phage gp29-like protein
MAELNVSVGSNGDLTEAPIIFTPSTPNRTPIMEDVSKGFSSFVQIARDVLLNPDIAYRTDRTLQEQMTRDPIVMGPLLERKLAVAQLEWQIVPEDEDENQDATSPDSPANEKPFFPSEGGSYDTKTMAKKVERIVRRMMGRQDFFKQLLWADFRGTGASEINWEFDSQEQYWYVSSCIPQHGDSITYDKWGDPRILTREHQTGGRQLSEQERDRLVIHTYQPDMGFFYKGEEAGYRFKGRGLRDIIWPYWWLAHNATRFWVRFIQRFGMGFVQGRYPMGNAAAKTAIESVLRNLIEDSMVSIPVPADATDKESYGIEFSSMPGMSEKATVFKEFVEDWAAKHIRLILVGQEQAHQEAGDGLGSGRALALKDTFLMYRNDSAIALGETLTKQLVPRIVRYNFGDVPIRLKWSFLLEKRDYEQQKKRVEAAKDAGIQVGKSWVYKTLDIPMPLPGEDVVDFKASAMPNPFDPMGAPSGDENDQQARMLFKQAIAERGLTYAQ